MTRTRRQVVATLMLVGLSAGVLAGCGDDDDSDATDTGTETTAAGDDGATDTTAADDGGTETTEETDSPDASGASAEVCTTYADVTAAFSGEPDPDELAPMLDTLDEEAPEEVADSMEVMTSAARTVIDSGGEDFSAFESPEFSEAMGEVDPYLFENCEFDTKLEATGTEYSFDGMPDEVEAGEVAILFTNEGAEAHEIGIGRKADGVTESLDELLALGPEELEEKLEFVGGAFGAPTGDQGMAIVDLEEGEYVALCFVPVGTMMEDGEMTEGDGPPHFEEGMALEFTVTG
jgi:hypothetical protein